MESLKAFQQQLRTRRPAGWDQLPDFPLYMDQVLSYMDRQIIHFDQDTGLTATMVNNYTKNGLVPRTEGKKYSREHLAYLTTICILKRVLSARDMDMLIRQELAGSPSVPERYGAFLASLDNALNLTAQELDPYTDEENLADAAIHFALLSYAAGVVSDRYVALLREQEGAEGKKSRKKERKQDA